MSYVTDYREKGIAVIPNVFSEEECNELKAQAYSVEDREIKAAGYSHAPSETIYNKKSLIFFPALANEYINRLRIDSRMQDIVKEFIGNDVKQINNQIYFREAGDMDQFAWHRDTIFRESNNFTADIETDYLQTIIAVDDINEDNGAVEFIEGSHHWEDFAKPRNLRVFDRGNLKGTKYTAKKGSVLLWSVMIVHGSDSNFSNADRMTYMNGFCKARATPTYPSYMIDGKVIERIDPKAYTMITIVISSYQYGHLASHCIESVLSQTKRPERILFVDDGAGDCEHLQKIYPEVEYVLRSENLGVVDNFDDMLHRVNSEFVMFLGADNWVRSDTVEVFENVVTQNECDVVIYDIMVTGELKKEILNRHPNEVKSIWGDYYWTRNGHHGSMLYRTKLGQEIGYKKRVENSSHTEEDWNLWNEMIKKNARVVRIPQAFLYYRRHRENFLKY